MDCTKPHLGRVRYAAAMGAQRPRLSSDEIRTERDRYEQVTRFPSPVSGLWVRIRERRVMGDLDRYIELTEGNDGPLVLSLAEYYPSQVAFSLDGARLYAQRQRYQRVMQRV